MGSAVVRLATKRLIGRSLQLRRKYAGFLLNSIRYLKSQKTQDDLGKGCHTQSTEPYFYEAAYLHVRETLIPVNDDGECVVANKGLGFCMIPLVLVSQTLYLVGNLLSGNALCTASL